MVKIIEILINIKDKVFMDNDYVDLVEKIKVILKVEVNTNLLKVVEVVGRISLVVKIVQVIDYVEIVEIDDY